MGADADYQSGLGALGKILRRREELNRVRPARKRAVDGKIWERGVAVKSGTLEPNRLGHICSATSQLYDRISLRLIPSPVKWV